jgi:cytochrome c oxidase subunit 2
VSATETAVEGPALWLPAQASNLAASQDAVLLGLIAASVLTTALIVGVMLYFGVKYRKGSSADRTPMDHATAAKIEVAWLVPTAVVFLGFFFWGGYVFYRAYTPPLGDALQMNVIGKQWMWKIQHPDGILEFNELHVPVGQTVVLTMTSEDVVHSFGIPAFRVKKDVIPGTYTRLWFRPTEPGRFHLTCNQYCGLDHSRMRGEVIAMTPADYAQWLVRQRPSESLAQKGRALYDVYGCAACHGPDANAHAPSLAGLYGRTVTLGGGARVVADSTYIRDAILDPKRQVVAGYQPIMPSYQGRIDEEGVLALIGYLRTRKAEAGEAGQ